MPEQKTNPFASVRIEYGPRGWGPFGASWMILGMVNLASTGMCTVRFYEVKRLSASGVHAGRICPQSTPERSRWDLH
jgi:hypothetical protein